MQSLLDKLFDSLGGNRPLAKALALNESTVSRWRSNGIPNTHVADVAHYTGVGEDELRYANSDAKALAHVKSELGRWLDESHLASMEMRNAS